MQITILFYLLLLVCMFFIIELAMMCDTMTLFILLPLITICFVFYTFCCVLYIKGILLVLMVLYTFILKGRETCYDEHIPWLWIKKRIVGIELDNVLYCCCLHLVDPSTVQTLCCLTFGVVLETRLLPSGPFGTCYAM